MAGTSALDLLDQLIQQTRFGNIKWTRTGNHEYSWIGSVGTVTLLSVDNDGLLPIKIVIKDEDGQISNSWIVGFESDPEEEAFDDRARALWNLVASENDVIARMVRDLRDMPPF